MVENFYKNAPLFVIAGPTASGKTDLAVKLARKFGGEIICADSRTIYKHMDIGTAKPTAEDREIVKHWGLDLVEPGEPYSAADFKSYAENVIKDIRMRGKIPMLVGGTGLYIDSIIFDYRFGEKADPVLRKKLEAMTIQELVTYCKNNNVHLPENSCNKRYVIRAIEQKGVNNNRQSTPIENCIIVGITTNREELRARIKNRAEHIFEHDVVKEAKRLGEIYGWDSEAMTGNIYPLIRDVLDDKITTDEAREKFFYKDWQLAKRQLTWLKRNKYIHWLGLDEAEHFLAHEMAGLEKI